MVMCGSSFDVVGNQVGCTESSHVGVKVAGGDRWMDLRSASWTYYSGSDSLFQII
jgi:hypothetical protein